MQQKQGGQVEVNRDEVNALPPPKGLVKHKFGLSDVNKMRKSKGEVDDKKPGGMRAHYKKKGKKKP